MPLTILWILALAALVVASAVASYLRLLMRRLTRVAGRKLFQAQAGKRFQADRERVGISLSTLHGAVMALFTIGLAGLLILRPASPWQPLAASDRVWSGLGATLLIVLCVIAVFDQLIPFILVARHDEPEVILAHWMPVLRAALFLALPLTFSILISTTIARLLEPEEPEEEPENHQENFEQLIEVGEQEGLIEKGEGEMLQSVVDFGDQVVREVMTPRPEIAAVEISSSVEELRRLIRERRHSRYPVYRRDLDHIEGIVSLQDLTSLPLEEQSKVSIQSLVRPVAFVPETKRNTELLRELRQSTTQFAIVIDEYGGVAGIVTIEDLVEEIVGDIRDEVEPHAKDIVKESETTYVAAGQTELAQLSDLLHVDVEGKDYSTVAGLLFAQLGHVPMPGEKVTVDGLVLEVLEANTRTVLKVRLYMPPAEHTREGRSQ